MHAIVVERPGGPEVMQWKGLPAPVPGPGEALVDVAYAGVNFVDTYQRTGLYPVDLPVVLGLEGAGVVRASERAGFTPGNRVAWTGHQGSYAEVATIDEERLVAIPDDIPIDVAAAVMLQGITAHYLVTTTFPLAPGHRCLIHAGAGGVGRLLIQLAKRRGAEVFATAGGPAKVAIAEACGADHVIDYQATDFQGAVEAIGGSKALDVVYDGVGGATFDRGLELLRPRGMMVTYGNASGPVPPFEPLRLARAGSLYVTRPMLNDHIPDAATLRERAGELFAAIGTGELDVLIGERFSLADAADAHRALESRRTVGKVLLEV